jgi:hypothetical protein
MVLLNSLKASWQIWAAREISFQSNKGFTNNDDDGDDEIASDALWVALASIANSFFLKLRTTDLAQLKSAFS